MTTIIISIPIVIVMLIEHPTIIIPLNKISIERVLTSQRHIIISKAITNTIHSVITIGALIVIVLL